MSAARHSWRRPARFELKTERECRNCGMIRVTRHDGGANVIPWVEFWRFDRVAGLCVRIEARGTPACEPGDGNKG